MALVFVGLGSNLGNRENYLAAAKEKIASAEGILILAESSLLETDPVDYIEQPRFINQVILIDTGLDPEELLDLFKEIEVRLGRKKRFPRGPREIDIDILLFDHIIYRTERLVIPHPEILNRDFVLRHLVELDPDLSDPVSEKKYREVLQNGFYQKY